MTNRSTEDEFLLASIANLTPERTTPYQETPSLIIYDARSYLNALANRVVSGGYENTTDYYKGCALVFCDIDNIHGVRTSISSLHDVTNGLTTKITETNMKLLSQIESTNWLQLLSKILQAVNNILDTILVKQTNVLVHCSDGWDRTAQLCSLAQLCLDPHYRTIEGFITLIEKDWLSFGH